MELTVYGMGGAGLRSEEEKSRRAFGAARRRAWVGRWVRWFRGVMSGGHGDGCCEALACFASVAGSRAAWRSSGQYLDAVPVERIVGSVGRCDAFDGEFLPVCSCTSDRWQRVYSALRGGVFLPPVRLYRIGEGYFVSDGNHRVSASRYAGVISIEAIVTDLRQWTTGADTRSFP